MRISYLSVSVRKYRVQGSWETEKLILASCSEYEETIVVEETWPQAADVATGTGSQGLTSKPQAQTESKERI